MNIKQLQYFITSADQGSFSKAAEIQHVAQPALSQSIRKLEEELDVKLFKRVPRGVVLTDSGRELVDYARNILIAIERAKITTTGSEHNPVGYVKLGIPSSLCRTLIKPLYMNVLEKYPRVHLGIEEGTPELMQRKVVEGIVDMNIQYSEEAPPSVELQPLMETELYLVGKSNIVTGSKDIQFKDLENYSLMYATHQHKTRALLESLAVKKNIKLNFLPAEFGFFPSFELLKKGIVSSILPWDTIHEEFEKGELTARLIINPKIKRKSYLAIPINRQLSNASLKVREIILDVIKKLQQDGQIRAKLFY